MAGEQSMAYEHLLRQGGDQMLREARDDCTARCAD
jgi:hypothetical protein